MPSRNECLLASENSRTLVAGCTCVFETSLQVEIWDYQSVMTRAGGKRESISGELASWDQVLGPLLHSVTQSKVPVFALSSPREVSQMALWFTFRRGYLRCPQFTGSPALYASAFDCMWKAEESDCSPHCYLIWESGTCSDELWNGLVTQLSMVWT